MFEFPFDYPTFDDKGQFTITFLDNNCHGKLYYSCMLDSYDIYTKVDDVNAEHTGSFVSNYPALSNSILQNIRLDNNATVVKRNLSSVIVACFTLCGSDPVDAFVSSYERISRKIFNSLNHLLDVWRVNDKARHLIPPSISRIHVNKAWIACIDTQAEFLHAYRFLMSTRAKSNIPPNTSARICEPMTKVRLSKIDNFLALAHSYKYEGSNEISLLHCAFALEVATNDMVDSYLRRMFTKKEIKRFDFSYSQQLSYAYVVLSNSDGFTKELWKEINKIRKARNKIAHGTSNGVSDKELESYLDSAQQYINLVKQYLEEEAT